MATAEDLKSRILDSVRREPSPPRQELRRRLALTLGAAIVVPLVAFFVVGAVHPGPRPLALMLATTGGALGIALAAVWTAYGRGGQMVGRARARLLAMTFAAPATFVIWKLVWSGRYDHMADAWAERP